MTEPQSKAAKEAGELSKTTQSYLREVYRERKYNRRKEFESKYIEKGKVQEEAAITLYTRFKKEMFFKNEERVNNEFITGEYDLISKNAKKGIDIKCSWSLFTFPFADDKLTDNYVWQNHGYMYLSGAEKWITAFCLVNAPANLIEQEKKFIWYRMNMPDDSDALYIERCIEVEKNLIFNKSEFDKENPGFDWHCRVWEYDIPLNERVVECTVERSDEAIERIKKEVTKSRYYLNSL